MIDQLLKIIQIEKIFNSSNVTRLRAVMVAVKAETLISGPSTVERWKFLPFVKILNFSFETLPFGSQEQYCSPAFEILPGRLWKTSPGRRGCIQNGNRLKTNSPK